MDKKKVLLVNTGGTISSEYSEAGVYSPVISANGLIDRIPKAYNLAYYDTIQIDNTLSFALTPKKIFEIIELIRSKLVTDNYVAAIITQGTATMEETSFLADLLWDLDKPLIFTGAMINASEKDWDGGRNLLNSIITAISPGSKGLGVLVCMSGEIHAARDVVKLHKSAIKSFYSLNSGPIGIVNGDCAIFYRKLLKRKVFKTCYLEEKVDIIKVTIGDDASLLKASINNGAKAIVIESFPGSGGVTPEIANVIRKESGSGVIFVSTPRSPLGSMHAIAGGGCGSFDLKSLGVIMGGDLTSVKVRMLLMVVLPLTQNHIKLTSIFNQVSP